MSTEIVARFYFKERGPPVDEVFCRMARIFDEWPQASREWNGLTAYERNRHTVSFRREDRLSSDALCQAAAGRSGPEGLLSTTTSFRCWRFTTGQPESGSVGAWVEAWGEAWGMRHHEDRRLGGDAALSVFDCGPFCMLTEPSNNPRREEINTRVEENLDALTGLLFRLIEALEPWSMKVFTAQGLYLPFNAHLAYYRDEAGVLDDLALIADVWDRGLSAHRIGPLQSHRLEDMTPAFHAWRSAPQREQLWRELDTLLPRRHAVTTEVVRRVLRSGRFDTYTMPTGVTMLEYPDFMNAFLDRFYLETLSGGAGLGS